MIGVSPAYFISRYGNRFSAADVAEGLAEIAQIGFESFQLEIFHRENVNQWLEGGARQVRQRSKDLGLQTTQFVAHFLLHAFADGDSLKSDRGLDDMQQVLEVVAGFEECRVVTIPLPPFEAPALPSISDYQRISEHFITKLARLLTIVEKAERRLALEIMPSALIGGIDGFQLFYQRLGAASLGLNFDTGHACAAKENLYLVPAKLGKRILGTHLCDNFGHENLSLRPGAGSIDWHRLIQSLLNAGYRGSLDVEIICEPEKTQLEYRKGRAFIETLMDA